MGTTYIIRVLLQTSSNELFERLGEVALQHWGRVLGDQEQDAHRVQVSIWRLALGHFNRRDTHAVREP